MSQKSKTYKPSQHKFILCSKYPVVLPSGPNRVIDVLNHEELPESCNFVYMDVIQNKIAESGLITLDLEQYMPDPESVAGFDLQPFLFQGLILREKDFRAALAEHDFSAYQDKYVGVYCSSDALIPMWAYMLVMTYLQGIAGKVYAGDTEEVVNKVAIAHIEQLDPAAFAGGRLVIKGCGKRNTKEDLYIAICQKLLPVARSIMFGEPCSTVPIYKKKKTGVSE